MSPNGRRLLDRVAFLAPEPIPEFLLDVRLPSSFETPASPAPQDEGSGATHAGTAAPTEAAPEGPHAEEATQEPSRSTRAAAEPSSPHDETFDTRAALAELYAYSLAAPTEIEGRYAQPAFTVHRLVQDYARAIMEETRKDKMRHEALAWVYMAFEGDSSDVRMWPKLDPLAIHVAAVLGHTEDAIEPIATLCNNLGILLMSQAREGAAPLFRRALEIRKKIFGPKHFKVAEALGNLGAFLWLVQHQDIAAESILKNALLTLKSGTKRSSEAEVSCLLNLGHLYDERGDLANAEIMFGQALNIFAQHHDPSHPTVSTILSGLASVKTKTGEHREAESLLRRALKIDKKAYGPNHTKVGIRLNNLSHILRKTNRPSGALRLISRAVKIHAVYLGPDHPYTTKAADNYHILLLELGASEDEAAARVAAAMRGV